ncbi:MAG: o-succinylbenzoate synthase [Rubrobacteraceae bacterium]|nr:o-succinylbenzoate synthase [Rubrobacteraceae bacterium]MBA3615932.1 o-succinylbenzoate synthase [Rubrobacteraceae bacterium]MDQ3252276.1 o-succinylbenzoate synthase [Actinomycetota bacterium]MDQ3438505.1 o-succinylbenzoate synthase [Actinomycetota bacterium]
MKLARFDLYRYSLPFSRPLTLAGITLLHREGLLLRLTGDDGSVGWGECAPLPGFSRENLGDATSQLRRFAGSIMGRQATDDWVDPYGEFGGALDGTAPSVRFGFELAVWNLYGASSGKMLTELVTPSPRDVVPVNGLLSGSPAEVLEEARLMRDAGYRSVKLKVGARTVAEDVALVRALGEELGDGISLRLDANLAWAYEEAAEFSSAAARFEYVEEPLADPAQLPDLVREFGVPVTLDESLVSMEPEELEEHRYALAFVLKPTLLGGISRTLRVAERALRLGVTPVISSAYESGVGTAALVALAAGIGDRPVAAGLDTYRTMAEDVLETSLNLPAPSIGVRETINVSRTIDVRSLERL